MQNEEEARAEENRQNEEEIDVEPEHNAGLVAGLRRSKRKRPPEDEADEPEVEPARKRAAITPATAGQRRIQFSPLAMQQGQAQL